MPEFESIMRLKGGQMEKRKETREMHYKLAVKLLEMMVKNGVLLPEESEKIDALNREYFSPELAEVYV